MPKVYTREIITENAVRVVRDYIKRNESLKLPKLSISAERYGELGQYYIDECYRAYENLTKKSAPKEAPKPKRLRQMTASESKPEVEKRTGVRSTYQKELQFWQHLEDRYPTIFTLPEHAIIPTPEMMVATTPDLERPTVDAVVVTESKESRLFDDERDLALVRQENEWDDLWGDPTVPYLPSRTDRKFYDDVSLDVQYPRTSVTRP